MHLLYTAVMISKRIQEHVRVFLYVLTYYFITILFIWFSINTYEHYHIIDTHTKEMANIFFRTLRFLNKRLITVYILYNRRKNNNYPFFMTIEVRRKFFFFPSSSSCIQSQPKITSIFVCM